MSNFELKAFRMNTLTLKTADKQTQKEKVYRASTTVESHAGLFINQTLP